MMSKQQENKQKKGSLAEIVELAKTIFWAGLIAIGIRSFLIEPFNIPSGSMIPTLLVGDYLFVTKYSYGYSRFAVPYGSKLPFQGRIGSAGPERGDVVVFRPSGQPDIDFIKRVIGLPGDKIQMRQGRLYINDQLVQRQQIEDYVDPDNPLSPPVPQYIETLPNGKQHHVIESAGDEGYLDNTPVYQIPADHYFMMGDNRDNSQDSRAPRYSFGNMSPDTILSDNELLYPVGFISRDNLIGPAQLLFWSYGPGFTYLNPISWIKEIRAGRVLDIIR